MSARTPVSASSLCALAWLAGLRKEAEPEPAGAQELDLCFRCSRRCTVVLESCCTSLMSFL